MVIQVIVCDYLLVGFMLFCKRVYGSSEGMNRLLLNGGKVKSKGLSLKCLTTNQVIPAG